MTEILKQLLNAVAGVKGPLVMCAEMHEAQRKWCHYDYWCCYLLLLG